MLKKYEEYGISIIIPVLAFNNYFKCAIESCLQQDVLHKEIIVISKADILNEIYKIYMNYDCIKYIDAGETVYSGERRNIGIKKANYEYIAFMDADDWFYSKDVLSKLLIKAKKQKSEIIGGSCVIYDELRKRIIYRNDLIIKTFEGYCNFSNFQKECGFYRFIYKKTLFDRGLKFTNLKRFQDSVFLVNALIMVEKFYLIPDIIYVYRKYKTNDIDFIGFYDHNKGVDYLLKIALQYNYDRLMKRMLKNINNNFKLRRLSLSEQIKYKKEIKKIYQILFEDIRSIIKFSYKFPYSYMKVFVKLFLLSW